MGKLERLRDIELITYVTNVTRGGMLLFIGIGLYSSLYFIFISSSKIEYSMEALFMPTIMMFVVGGIVSLILSFLTYPIFKVIMKIATSKR